MSKRDAELRALQARAYGRDADIGDDPAALRRLAALESREFDIIDTGAEELLAELRGPHPQTPPGATSREPADPLAADMNPPSRSDRARLFAPAPRPAWLVVGALCVVVAAIGAGAFAFASRPAPPGIITTLGVDESGEWPEVLGDPQEGSAVFEDYLGITFIRNPEWITSDRSGENCLLAANSDVLLSNDFGGFQVGCSAGAFPAVIQFTVDSNTTDELQQEFSEGTALQFTLRGNAVEVRVDE
ncbi:hypothetical protein [Microbacterium sp. 3J1]|uniref:hypothetical protein n=1 Tax=Microbacterium sp. 3J1 TaxID=861269 RepID=UPI000A9B1BFA|nr:hypothetical protein [Microbacterium sp. 3J1]